MWSRALAVLCALGLAVAALVPASSADVAQRGNVAAIATQPETETTQRPVVIATLPCRPSLQATSSGFLIDDELVVTVAHAIYDSRDFAVRDATGLWHRPEVVHMDLDLDLAVLRIPGLVASPMNIARAGTDDPVRMVAGAASGTSEGAVLRRVRLTTETIGDLSRKTERSGYELSVAIKGGDSGAAVVDTDDNLIGVVFARSTRSEASWVTAASEVANALQRRSVPSWECENPSEVELILEVPNLDGEPEELALARASDVDSNRVVMQPR